jgi:CheY-like chemotaxis protein
LLQIRSSGGPAWRGRHAPALPDKTAAWVGVVKPQPAAPPAGAIELPPAAEPEMQLVDITESMMEALQGAPGPSPPEPLPPLAGRSPTAVTPPAAALAGEGTGGRRAAAPAEGPGPLVLVADDDPEALTLLSRVVEKLGWRVIQARDGREALEAVRRERPALAVLDAMMPGVHGFDVCRNVKDDPALRATRVVLCSAVYRGAVAAEAQVAFGADGYLEKPFRVREASRLFREALAGPEAPAPGESERRERARADWQQGAEALAAGRNEDAISLCRRATEVDPVCAEAHYYLGHALSREGMLFEAAAAFERAAELRPDADPTHSCLALLYERLGFRRAAGLAWARAAEACHDPGRRERIHSRLLAVLRP